MEIDGLVLPRLQNASRTTAKVLVIHYHVIHC